MLNKKIIFGVTGSIAAYKAAELIRILKKQGADIQVVMTKSAKEFISPLTLQALSGNPVLEDMWEPSKGNGMEHINQSKKSDLILIAPTSANFIAKLAQGIADDGTKYAEIERIYSLYKIDAKNALRKEWSVFKHKSDDRRTLSGDISKTNKNKIAISQTNRNDQSLIESLVALENFK